MLAYTLIRELGNLLSEVTFEIEDSQKNKKISFESREAAFAFLQGETINITRFWLANNLNTLEFSQLPAGYLAIDFWDFDNEVYDSDGPSEAMKNEKRQIALTLHETLVRNCGAILTYTCSADNTYAGANDHFDTADMVFEALRKHRFQTVIDVLDRPLYLWLVGLKKGTDLGKTLERVLRHDFAVTYADIAAVVWEHQKNRPYFLL